MLADVVSAMEAIVLNTTPSFLPGLAFRLAPLGGKFEELPASAGDTSRQFRVEPLMPTDVGQYIGPCWSVIGPIDVRLRYLHEYNSDSWNELAIMAASDARSIVAAMTEPPAGSQWPSSLHGGVLFAATSGLAETKVKGVYNTLIRFSANISVRGG